MYLFLKYNKKFKRLCLEYFFNNQEVDKQIDSFLNYI